MSASAILQSGRNCWQAAPARRAAVLLGADACFQAMRAALARAERSIYIVGWDVDSALAIPRSGPDDDLPQTLGDFLDGLTARRPSLEIFILIWDFASLYADANEWLPLFQANWKTHGRLHFHMDARHPPGATQHQKFVVVDDDVAFCGGVDLRLPSPDTLRHDVQAIVQGEPARALGELARTRWQRATGDELAARAGGSEAWPEGWEADFSPISTGISRTEPEFAARQETREIEELYLDAISAARSTIYIENHYLTAPKVTDALVARLRNSAAPAIIIVLPQASRGWLAENEVGIRQAHTIRRLREADLHGRLRVCTPCGTAAGERTMEVAGKVLIVDHRLLAIGSANLSQRSMRLDAELTLALEANSQETRQQIARMQDRLLAAYLGSPAAVAASDDDSGFRLLEAIDAQAARPRGLREFDVAPAAPAGVLPSGWEGRPEHPVSPERFSEMLAPEPPRSWTGFSLAGLALLSVFIALGAIWYWTPVDEWLNVEALAEQVASYREHRFALPLLIVAYVAGGLVVVPITVLVVITVLAFGMWRGMIYALLGALASASVVYGLGHSMGRDSIRRLAGARLNRVSHALARRGIIAMMLVRWVPLAPFSIVNLIAGASHIRFGQYLIGSALGLAVDIVFIAVFMQQLQEALRDPGWASIGIIIVLVAAAAGAALALRRWLRRQRI
ncbi:VTT domain-containing protein [soil metagenome]